LRASKAAGVEDQVVDKSSDETDRILLGNVVVKNLREEHVLGA
jgi:hypothetical protein